MAESLTIAKAQEQHKKAIESNRKLGVIEYNSGEKQSDQVWEVKEGRHHLPIPGETGGKRITLAPGMRFHPTENQVAQTLAGRGGLQNKAEEVSHDTYKALHRSERTPMVAGANIGLREVPNLGGRVLAFALEQNLTPEDFEGVTPDGPNGNYTKQQVEDIVARK